MYICTTRILYTLVYYIQHSYIIYKEKEEMVYQITPQHTGRKIREIETTASATTTKTNSLAGIALLNIALDDMSASAQGVQNGAFT